MKRTKKLWTAVLAVAAVLAMTVTGFAATYSTPAEAAAGVTGKTLDEVLAERRDGKTFGTIADEAGKLEEFKAAVLEIKEDRLDALVKDGSITQAEADEILAAIRERQAVCDGTGGGGLGLGLGRGQGQGGGQGAGAGRGAGGGRGMGLRDGSCYLR